MSGNFRSLVRPLARVVRDHVLPHALPAARRGRGLGGDARTVRVVGLLSSATGLGSSARLCAMQLHQSGYDLALNDVSALFGIGDGLTYAPAGEASKPAAASIYHLNPPMLLAGIIGAGVPSYYRTFNIGYWAWELEKLPDDWVRMLGYLDAVMVPSTFCRDAVLAACDKPVSVVPHPVNVDVTFETGRPRDMFEVLCVFNFGSSFARKNPIAAVRAFQHAFGHDARARLTLKTSAGARYPDEMAHLRAAAGHARNIEIIDAVWSEQELAKLYQRAHALLSLHRSEGFGLTIAEAMLHGCPVVTTAWSGNLDFCTSETAMLVPCELVPFADTDRAYARVKGGRWAEPDVEVAAAHLRTLRRDPAQAKAQAVRARVQLSQHIGASTYATALRTLCGSGL